MTACIVTIADTEELARTLDCYAHCFLGPDIESYFMTYTHNLLSGHLLRQADLFILELLRRDDIGYRAEAIFAAEKWLPIGKRVLIVSGTASSAHLNIPLYWDLSAHESLHARITRVLMEPVPAMTQLDGLRVAYKEYCRPAINHHKA